MFVNLLILLAVAAAVLAIVTFVLYGRARMQEQEEKEKLFLRIHSICLFILLLTGIAFMFFMVETSN